jgi:peptidoglycan/xylan/chitin deacetylase (PgdA/CDA1 family)
MKPPMHFRVLIPCLALLLAACGKAQEPKPKPTPTPTATPKPTPKPTPTPTPFVLNPASHAVVLCYHRFEEKPRPDGLGLKPSDFEAQLQALKDNGITVIPMDDFLAWRRGEKNIPEKSAVITLDDGWLSGYEIAWPILKKFGYPFTMYIYTDYVKGGIRSGGQSMTWEQIAEMRDAGVDIASHTVSHTALNVRKGKTEEQYRAWLTHELKDSKDMLEQKLGIKVKTLAYPYGIHNEVVRDVAMKAGYEAAFTVYGQHLGHEGDPATIGRYAVMSTDPGVFKKAINFSAAIAAAPGQAAPPPGVPASAAMLTAPMQGETISNPKPVIKINIATFGAVDPKSVEMRISGFGIVPAVYDATSQTLTYPMHQQLREHEVTVIVSARANGRKTVANWSFNFDPNAAPSPTPTPAATSAPAAGTPADETGLPPMKPAE